MEGDTMKKESGQKFMGLVSNEKDCLNRDEACCFEVAEEKQLELRLAPPGDWLVKENSDNNRERKNDEALLTLGQYSKAPRSGNPSSGAKRGFSDTVETEAQKDGNGNQVQKLSSQNTCSLFPHHWSSAPPSPFHKDNQQKPTFLHFQSPTSLPVLTKESSQVNGMKAGLQKLEMKTGSSPSTNVNNTTSQTRTTSVPVVGWPPIRSFRKNIATSSSKTAVESQNGVSQTKEKIENTKKGLFIKINMDGVPIGRKVDLSAYDSYAKLSSSVDELFRGLLEAQRDSSAASNQKSAEERRPITGLLDGSGEYTLVYEDNEGDRMLVGDIPWEMFVSSVKRLRVLKSSELSALRIASNKDRKAQTNSAVR